MKRITLKNAVRFSVALALLVFSTSLLAQGQSRIPLLQNIEVSKQQFRYKTDTNANPFSRKNGKSQVPSRKTSVATLADVEIPGFSGVLIEGLNGGVIMDNNSDIPFNPASNVKLATAYAVLKTFGPNFRFPTNVWTDGQVDKSTGILYGNLYVSGRDPMFNYEHAVSIANELNKLGIRTVTGDLVVSSDFVMSFQLVIFPFGKFSSKHFKHFKSFGGSKSCLAKLPCKFAKFARANSLASVTVEGGNYVQLVPNTAKLLFTHESAPMRAIVKATLIFSNNFLSERLGDMLGGHYAVARIVHLKRKC